MFADRFSKNVKGVSWEPAWSHRTVVSALLAYVCKCLCLSVRDRGRGRPRSTCARASVFAGKCAWIYSMWQSKYLRARVYVKASVCETVKSWKMRGGREWATAATGSIYSSVLLKRKEKKNRCSFSLISHCRLAIGVHHPFGFLRQWGFN